MNSVPTLVRFVPQTGHHQDCAVACLAMLGGVMYEDALLACAKVKPNVLTAGLGWDEMRKAARRLGLKTRIRTSYDIHEETGILHVSRVALGLGPKNEHVVFLWEGRIIDGDGEMWLEINDYLRHYGYEARALLVLNED